MRLFYRRTPSEATLPKRLNTDRCRPCSTVEHPTRPPRPSQQEEFSIAGHGLPARWQVRRMTPALASKSLPLCRLCRPMRNASRHSGGTQASGRRTHLSGDCHARRRQQSRRGQSHLHQHSRKPRNCLLDQGCRRQCRGVAQGGRGWVGPMADDVRRQPGQAAPLSACGFRFHSSWLSVSRTAGRAAVRPRRPAPAARGGSAPSRPGR